MSGVPGSKSQMKVELTAEAKAQLRLTCNNLGLAQFDCMKNLVEWFVNQREIIQAFVLGRVPTSISAEIAQLEISRLVQSQSQTGVSEIAIVDEQRAPDAWPESLKN